MPANTTGWWAEFHAFINGRITPMRASLSAVQHQEAHISIVLPKLVASMSGVEHPKGDLVTMIRELSASLNAEHSQEGFIETELQELSAALNGKQTIPGSLAITQKKLIASLTGKQTQVGNIQASLKKTSSSINGYMRPSGGLVLPMKKINAALIGKHYQTGTIAANLQKSSATLVGKHYQTGTIAAAFKKAVASMNGKQAQQGQVTASLKKLVSSFNGTFTGVTPVVFDVVGTPGSENIGNVTCTINPTGTADVLVFATSGGASLYEGTFGAGSTKMKILGRVKYRNAQHVVYLIKGVSSGSQTATIKASGGGWSQCVAIAYKGAVDWKLAKSVFGSGSTASQSTSPGSNGLSVQSFSSGDDSITFSSLTGGTARLNETAGFNRFTIRETNISNTFGASLSSSVPWGGLVAEATPSSISGPKINYTAGRYQEDSGGTQTFDVICDIGDYVLVAIVRDRARDPSSMTCAGSAMTLIDTQTYTSGVGTGYIKFYRSSSAMGSSGAKTVSVTATGRGWYHIAGCSISNVTSFGTAVKANGTSSAPSHSLTCSAGQLIIHGFVCASSAQSITGTNVFDSPGGSQLYLFLNAAHENTTFGVSNTMNWGSMGIVIS